MDDVKGVLTSKTIWGAIVVLGATIASMLKVDLGDSTGWVLDITTLFGATFAIIGRISAVKKIELIKK